MMASGNAVVVVAAEPDPYVAIAFAEVLATSDVPAGVVNMLTGSAAEIAPHLAAHADVNALDLTGGDDRAGHRAGAGGGGHGQAGLRATGARSTSPPPRAGPAAGVRGDQDHLAPDRRPVARGWIGVLTDRH